MDNARVCHLFLRHYASYAQGMLTTKVAAHLISGVACDNCKRQAVVCETKRGEDAAVKAVLLEGQWCRARWNCTHVL